MQVQEDFVSAFDEQRPQIVGAGEDGFDALLRNPVLLAALPGRKQSTGHRGRLGILQPRKPHSLW
jgi:hypothetical protein